MMKLMVVGIRGVFGGERRDEGEGWFVRGMGGFMRCNGWIVVVSWRGGGGAGLTRAVGNEYVVR